MRKIIIIAMAVLVLACTKETGPGLSSIDNPRADKLVSVYGETVTITFAADAAWTAELQLKSEGDWAAISQTSGNEKAGQGIIRVRFSKNETEDERTAELFVTVDGYDKKLIATLTQAAGENKSAMSEYLNKYMHKRLVNEYLWADEYAKLDVNMGVSWDKFLYTYLTQLGDTNIEDASRNRKAPAPSGIRTSPEITYFLPASRLSLR